MHCIAHGTLCFIDQSDWIVSTFNASDWLLCICTLNLFLLSFSEVQCSNLTLYLIGTHIVNGLGGPHQPLIKHD